MRKSCWGAVRGREVILAIWVRRSFLEDCLANAVCSDRFDRPIAGSRKTRRPRRVKSGSPVRSSGVMKLAASDQDVLVRDPVDDGRALDGGDGNGVEEDKQRNAVSRDCPGALNSSSSEEEKEGGYSSSERRERENGPIKGVNGSGGWGMGDEGPVRRRSRALSDTSTPQFYGRMTDSVRVHWEPERLPSGEKVPEA